MSETHRLPTWDDVYDVVVVGYGFAGATTAIVAHDAGARVLLVEKAPHPGGNSIVSGGGVVLARDAAKAAAYLRATNQGRTPDDVVEALAQGMTELEEFLRSLAEALGVKLQYIYREQKAPASLSPETWATLAGAEYSGHGATYPFPGGETLWNVKIGEIPGFAGFPWARGLRAGGRLFKVVSDNVARRAIDVWLSSPAVRLLQDAEGALLGLVMRREGRQVAVGARRAVVLATGGFENNEEMRRQYFQAMPVYPVCTLTNTGDGVVMAQKAGAALWHMWHFHGGYGFKFPDLPVAIRHSVRGPRKPELRMPWIVVDKLGRRYMNEYPPAVQDTGARAMEYYDADLQDFPRIPSYLIFDEAGRLLGPIGDTIINDEGVSYHWSDDNLAEVERGWIVRTATVRELSTLLGLAPDALERTVERWNQLCDAGEDTDYGRMPTTMLPLRTPPFYGVAVWPIVSNTQGGPVHNARQQVLDAFGQPIPRLYAVGELGSLFGHLYLEAGNIAECFVGGRIAGRHAAAEPAREFEATGAFYRRGTG